MAGGRFLTEDGNRFLTEEGTIWIVTEDFIEDVVVVTNTGGGFIPFQRKRKRKQPRPIEDLVIAAVESLPNPTPTQVAKKVIPEVRRDYVLDNSREIAALREEITRLVIAIREENESEDEAAFLLLAA